MTDLELDPEAARAAAADAAFIRPPDTFAGHVLRPYTQGSHLLWLQFTSPADKPSYAATAFLYAHIAPLATVRAVAWDTARSREAVLEWADTLPMGAAREGVMLVEAIMARVEAVSVKVDPEQNSGTPGPNA
jgi:hypothetical protein